MEGNDANDRNYVPQKLIQIMHAPFGIFDVRNWYKLSTKVLRAGKDLSASMMTQFSQTWPVTERSNESSEHPPDEAMDHTIINQPSDGPINQLSDQPMHDPEEYHLAVNVTCRRCEAKHEGINVVSKEGCLNVSPGSVETIVTGDSGQKDQNGFWIYVPQLCCDCRRAVASNESNVSEASTSSTTHPPPTEPENVAQGTPLRSQKRKVAGTPRARTPKTPANNRRSPYNTRSKTTAANKSQNSTPEAIPRSKKIRTVKSLQNPTSSPPESQLPLVIQRPRRHQ